MNFQDGEYLTMCKETILKALECKGLIKDNNNDKYIVRSCPSCYDDSICSLWTINDKYCYEHNHCVMKQIVKLCKEACKDCSNIKRMTFTQCKDMNNCKIAKILKLLDIQEVE